MLILMLGAAGLTGLFNARARPIVRRTRVELAGWPGATAPIKLALLSDIHLGNWGMDRSRLEQVVAQVNAARPDLVLIAGDFVVGRNGVGAPERAAGLAEPLSRLTAPLGAVAVLGNHDYWTAPAAIRAALSRARVTVLDNQALPRGPIVVAGVGDVFSRHDQLAPTLAAARARAAPIVALTHSPDLASRLPTDVQLLLAGHTHCGEVLLPIIGPLPPQSPRDHWRRLYDPRYRCGRIQDPGRVVIVTAGVGSGTVPLRFGAPPDIWLVTLGGRRIEPPAAQPQKAH